MLRFSPKTKEKTVIPEELKTSALPERLMELLVQRGFRTKEEIDRYLYPKKTDLYDPMLMQGMREAVVTIRDALAKGESITVFGDYDVDGVAATAILTDYLKGCGAKVRYYIPDRHGEGYGLNADAVRQISEYTNLLITVDCGITSTAEVALARQLGMRVIVTDHHRVPDTVPDCEAVLDPLIGDYPFSRLCGAGVAFKVVQALGGERAIEPYWDLAALATIADIVPLVDENRVIVTYGLQAMRCTDRPGIRALVESAGCHPESLNSSDVAFRIAPRINAGGRLALASRSVELLTTRDDAVAREIAEELNQDNEKRRELEACVLTEADRMVRDHVDFLRDRIILLWHEGWNTGVIGLAAARLVEKYRWPVILFSEADGLCVGSARSVPGVDIHRALSSCGNIFERFGGHAQAAGLTIRSDKMDTLKQRLNAAIAEQAESDAFIPTEEYDLELDLSDITEEFVSAFSAMQPTGFGNPQPVFCLRGVRTADLRTIGRDNAHLRLRLTSDRASCNAIGFRMGQFAEDFPDSIEATVNLSINEWQGKKSVQCELRQFNPYMPGRAFAALCAKNADQYDRQYLRLLAANASGCGELRESVDFEALEKTLKPLVSGEIQGTMICVHHLSVLRQLNIRLAVMDARVDYAAGHVQDIRCFNTVVFAPDWENSGPVFKRIIVADGFICDAERQKAEERFGKEALTVFPCPGSVYAGFAAGVLPDDEELRTIYRVLRRREGAHCSAAALAAEAGVAESKLWCALYIFKELDLISGVTDRLEYRLIPDRRVQLDESALRTALQSVKVRGVNK